MSLYARLVAFAVVLIALVAVGWKLHHDVFQAGYDKRTAEDAVATHALLVNNNRASMDLLQDAADAQRKKDAQIRNISSRLATALDDYSMLQRSTERSNMPSSTGTCTSGTGAGLSRPDAEFLEGYAARANRLRAALDYCQTQYNKVRAAQPKPPER